jgi:hypothetical protein
MTREVLERDSEGTPTMVVFRETPSEAEQRRSERADEDRRAREVEKSLRSPAPA